jgi:hypothetical protein
MTLTPENTPSALHPWLDSLNALYDIYVRVMLLKRKRAELRGLSLAAAYGYLAYAYARDVWFNLTTATRMFCDPAREFTFTARLKRYRAGGTTTQAAIAEFLCDELLDQADPDGDHC